MEGAGFAGVESMPPPFLRRRHHHHATLTCRFVPALGRSGHRPRPWVRPAIAKVAWVGGVPSLQAAGARGGWPARFGRRDGAGGERRRRRHGGVNLVRLGWARRPGRVHKRARYVLPAARARAIRGRG